MKPIVLFPEETAHDNGCGPVVALGDAAGQPIEISLQITRIMEQQTLDAVIWGSPDGSDWGTRPVLRLPHRYYCGSYHHVLDLTRRPEIRYLRLEYRLRGWLPQSPYSLAAFSVTVMPCHEEALAMGA